MPVPTLITDLSTTAASNYPQGSENVLPDLDNHLRAHAAFIAQLNQSIPRQVQSISASVAANALTVTFTATNIDFRSSTLTTGTATTISMPGNLSLTVPSGATLGTANGIAARLVVLAINNAGTVELAIVNMAGGNQLDESGVISTTAISGSSNTSSTIYSNSARTNVAYRVVGLIDITEATAGTWATAPTLVQGAGGNAASSFQSLGYGQTWTNVTSSRGPFTMYYNTTGKPIYVAITLQVSANKNWGITAIINSVCYLSNSGQINSGSSISLSFIVPPGNSYTMFSSVQAGDTLTWYELR